ncbi:YciI family protein [Dyella tabacisoli]|uniref:YCII-related domain-containing protein n=1 Tax=Dyella tabacisoli TaxID=2282381 RepID=A0A369UKQ0_9GAMM|nr:YciI family protein [Dyella tabacisoli]RDD80170.1 hypothetical protein DVJ77_18690 [Dyella tabacisoli]
MAKYSLSACRFPAPPFVALIESRKYAGSATDERHARSMPRTAFGQTSGAIDMKYFAIYIPDPKTNHGTQSAEQQETMKKFMEDSITRGEYISGGGFLPLADAGVVVRRTDGNTSVIDGPYLESKELIGGFAMLNYSSREAAIDGARRFMEVAGDGECTTYQIMDAPHPDA